MYIWQKKQWEGIMQRKSSLPHALLLRGRAGIGKHEFALELTRTLLCLQPSQYAACGTCPSCTWLAEGVHPDFRLVAPENEDENDETPKKKSSKKSQISVSQIRQLFDYLSLSTHQVQGNRIILISPAETLNAASANALLKMLEEPPAKTLFLLVTSQPHRLLPTILSRCQSIDMPTPNKAEAISWLVSNGVMNPEATLDYAGGAPLLAVQTSMEAKLSLINQLSQGAKLDPFISTPQFLSLGMEQALETIQKWVFDLYNHKLTQQVRYHVLQANTLQVLSKSVNLSLLMRFHQTLTEAKKTANHPLSNEMQMENVLLQYTQIFAK